MRHRSQANVTSSVDSKAIAFILPWQTMYGAPPLPFPTWARFPLPYFTILSGEQIAALSTPFTVVSMDDKWQFVVRADSVDFYRTWTGIPRYRLPLHETRCGAYTTHVWVNIACLRSIVCLVLLLPLELWMLTLLWRDARFGERLD